MELTDTSKTPATGSTTDETVALENNKRGCCTKKQQKCDTCYSRKSSASCCSITIKSGCCNIKMDDRAASETSCLQRPHKCVDLCQQGCCVTILCDGMRKRICLTKICCENDANLNKYCDKPVGFCKNTDTAKNCCKPPNPQEGCCGTGRSENEINRHGKNNCCSNPEESSRCSTVTNSEAPKQGCCATQENDEGKCKNLCCQGECSNEPMKDCFVCKRSDEVGEPNETNCCNKSHKIPDCCKGLGNGMIIEGCCKLLIKCCCKASCCDTTCADKDSQLTMKDCNCKSSGLTNCQCKCNEECTSERGRDRDECCNSKTASKVSLVKPKCCVASKDGCCSVKGCVDGEINPGRRNCCCCIISDDECGCQIDVGDEGPTNVGCSSSKCTSDKDCACKKDCCHKSAGSDHSTKKNCCITSQHCHCSIKGCVSTRTEKCCKLKVQCCCIHEQGCCITAKPDEDGGQIIKECNCQTAQCGDYYTCCCYKKTDNNTGVSSVSLTLGCCSITIESCYNCCNCKKARSLTSGPVQTACQTQKNCCCATADCNDKCDDTCGCKGNAKCDCCNSARASGIAIASAGSDDTTKKNCCVTSQHCHCSIKGCIATRPENCCTLEVQCCCIHEQGCCNTAKPDEDGSQIIKECNCQTAWRGNYYTCCGYKKTENNTGVCSVSLTLGCCSITIESCCNCCNCKKARSLTSGPVQTASQTQKNCCCTTADCNDKCDDACGCKADTKCDCCNSSRASGCCKAKTVL